MSSCKNCTNKKSITNTNSEITQKRIQNQVQTASSLYTMNFATSNSKINNNNEGIKHSSYQRRLNKMKQIHNETLLISSKMKFEAKEGNKTSNYRIGECSSRKVQNYDLDNFLNCRLDLDFYLKNKGIQKAYELYERLENHPTKLSLDSENEGYKFNEYIQDLSLITHDVPEIAYATYNDGVDGVFGSNTATNNMKMEDISDALTILVDYEFHEDSSNNVIFEIGDYGVDGETTKGGISLYHRLYKLYLMIGLSPSGTNGSFHYSFNINSNMDRNLFVIELKKLNTTDTDNLLITLYYNNDMIKSEVKSYPQSQLLFSDQKVGFGRSAGNGANEFAYHILQTDDTSYATIQGNSAKITGQYRIYNNSYEELLKSNYFSNNI